MLTYQHQSRLRIQRYELLGTQTPRACQPLREAFAWSTRILRGHLSFPAQIECWTLAALHLGKLLGIRGNGMHHQGVLRRRHRAAEPPQCLNAVFGEYHF